ncbi:MAG: hypothetical protein JNL08_13515 [Planctomycetes bacterium]|nr:hypothetical protein [Planctomycetota bacterium]
MSVPSLLACLVTGPLAAQFEPTPPRPGGPLPQVLAIPGAGWSLRYPAGWVVQANGPAAVLMPDPTRQPGAAAQAVSVAACAWQPNAPVGARPFGDQLANRIQNGMPGLRLLDIAALGQMADGIRIRFAAPTTPGGEVHVYAKNDDRTLVTLLAGGDAAALAQRTPLLVEMMASLSFAGAGAVPMQPGRPAGVPAGPPPGAVDPAVVGRWVCDSVQSSAPSWGQQDQGGTSFVTRTILELRRDGTFVRGSEFAGGNNHIRSEGAFQVTAAGRWGVAQQRDRTGKTANYLVLHYADGTSATIRYLFGLYEQLVLGEPNARTFWNRAG